MTRWLHDHFIRLGIGRSQGSPQRRSANYYFPLPDRNLNHLRYDRHASTALLHAHSLDIPSGRLGCQPMVTSDHRNLAWDLDLRISFACVEPGAGSSAWMGSSLIGRSSSWLVHRYRLIQARSGVVLTLLY